MLSMRKQIISNILLCLLAALIAGCSGRLAESGLQGSVRLVVVRGRGGSADIVARAFAPYFQEELGVEVVVENVEGGAGKVGLTQVYYAKPDGRTLVLGNFPSYVLSQELENGVFHDISEFEPIVGISGNEGNVLVASNDSPYNSLEELLEYDRAHRGQLHMAVTSGISNSSLAQTMLVSQTGLSATAFPHDDGNSCVKAVVSKRVNLAVCSGAAAQHFQERPGGGVFNHLKGDASGRSGDDSHLFYNENLCAHPQLHDRRIEGLDDIVGGLQRKPPFLVVVVVKSCHEDDRDFLGALVTLEHGDHLIAVHARHHDIQQDNVRLLLNGRTDGLWAILCDMNVVFWLENVHQHAQIGQHIIHDQQAKSFLLIHLESPHVNYFHPYTVAAYSDAMIAAASNSL